jgi:hypothetical protein
VTISPKERQYVLGQVTKLAAEQLTQLWNQAAALSDIDFAAFVTQAFPELVDPYAAMAADLAATWYDESPSTTNYTATSGPLPVAEQLTSSAAWALGADGMQALDRMQGTLQRAINDSARDTIVHNSYLEPKSRWVRHASANACEFCKMLATRTESGLYSSENAALRVVGRGKDFSTNFDAEGNRKAGGQAKGVKTRGARQLGEKYHDHCHCVAVEIRPGQSYTPPPYVEQWRSDYSKAFAAVPDGTPYDDQNSVLKAVLSEWRKLDSAN